MVSYNDLRNIQRGAIQKFILQNNKELISARACASQLKREDLIFRTYVERLPEQIILHVWRIK